MGLGLAALVSEDLFPGARPTLFGSALLICGLFGEWLDAPGARASHPTPEHLEPLFVIVGAAGKDRGRRVFHDAFWDKAVSGFAFG